MKKISVLMVFAWSMSWIHAQKPQESAMFEKFNLKPSRLMMNSGKK